MVCVPRSSCAGVPGGKGSHLFLARPVRLCSPGVGGEELGLCTHAMVCLGFYKGSARPVSWGWQSSHWSALQEAPIWEGAGRRHGPFQIELQGPPRKRTWCPLEIPVSQQKRAACLHQRIVGGLVSLGHQPHPVWLSLRGRNWVKGWKHLSGEALLANQVMGFPRLHPSTSFAPGSGPEASGPSPRTHSVHSSLLSGLGEAARAGWLISVGPGLLTPRWLKP